MADKGRNAGITGLIDMPNALTGTGLAKFQCKVGGFQFQSNVATRHREGRADADEFQDLIPLLAGGNLIVGFEVRGDAPPAPDALRGQRGTVTLQFAPDRTAVCAVLVTACQITYKDSAGDSWSGSLTCALTAQPVWTGFGTPPTASVPGPSDKEVFEGLAKALDPKGLQSSAVVPIDVYGIDNTDAAEWAKLGTLIASHIGTLGQGLKVRLAGFQRTGRYSGVVTLTLGLTDTAEDVTLPLTKTTIDPTHLQSIATAAALNGTPTAPTGDNFVKVATTTQRLNDGALLTVDSFGRRTSQDAVEMDGSPTVVDPSAIADSQTITKVTGSDVPPGVATPAGLLFREYQVRQLNVDQWQHDYIFARTTREDDIEHGGTFSRYTVTRAGETTVAQVVSHSGTADALGLSLFNNRKANVTFDDLSVRKITGGLALQTITTRADAQIVRARSWGGKLPTMTRLVSGVVQVYVAHVIEKGSNLWWVELASQNVPQVTMLFSLARRVSGNTLPMHFDLLGTANAAAFLGLPLRSVTYLGAEPEANIAIPAPRVADMVWNYRYDSLGIYTEEGITAGWRIIDRTSHPGRPALGWTNVSDLNINGPAPLPDADYDPFLA